MAANDRFGRQADGTAFGKAVLPHLDSAANLARWLVRDASLADDVMQDAVVRALGYFASFRGDNARAWLLRIVRNVAYDAIASRGAAPLAMPVRDVCAPADDPETAVARGQDHAWMHRAIATLPAELRECLILRELEELSYRDIAQVAGVPIGTVMSRLWRARQILLAQGKIEAGS